MTSLTRRTLLALITVAALIGTLPAQAGPAQIFQRGPDAAEAPFGDKVSPAIKNYSRAAPHLGTAGLLGEGGVAEAERLGFKTIVDLRTPAEPGQPAEAGLTEAAGLAYVSIPIAKGAPTEAQLARFAALMEDRAQFPILLHCGSANRVGALWTLYRTSKGVPSETAIEEGRAIGMKSREPQVRELLGLPAL